MTQPSLPLLILKIVLIFGVSWLAGWSLFYGKKYIRSLTSWYLTTVVGIAFLNLAPAIVSILGGNGKIGFALVLLLILSKLILSGNKTQWRLKFPKLSSPEKRSFICIFLLTALSSASYIAPFIVKGTSGFYSRGGGDHSTYLSLSSWYSDHRFWTPIEDSETMPPQPFWELKRFTRDRQKMCLECYQPLANQFVASSFISFLPGSDEETYTATVAMYVAIAGWGVALLLGHLLSVKGVVNWVAAIPVLFSNLLMYVANMQSIPFLLAVIFLPAVLLLYLFKVRSREWGIWALDSLPLLILHTALFAVYPHFYVLSLALLALMMFFLLERKSWIKFIQFFFFQGLGTVILANLYLTINIPLVFTGAVSGGGAVKATSWLKLLAAQAGVVEFATLETHSRALQLWIVLGVAGVCVSFFFFLRSLLLFGKAERKLICSWYSLFVIAAIYYNSRNFSWQMVRFSQFGHLLLLSGMGLGIAYWMKSPSRWLRSSVACVLILFCCAEGMDRAFAVRDVIGHFPTDQTEFRDADQLNMISVLKTIQEQAAGTPRLIYYFGPGYGVDHSGASVLFRSTSYLVAHGYDYSSFLKSLGERDFRLWDTKLLEQSLLVVNPPAEGEILNDLRPEAQEPPRWTFSKLRVFDTRDQTVSQLVGDAWNAPLVNPELFRYLKAEGSLVVWSHKNEDVRIRVRLWGDQKGGKLKVESQSLGKPLFFEVPQVREVRPSEWVEISQHVVPGPNVVLLTPVSGNGSAYWLLIRSIEVSSEHSLSLR